jgi:hypothetical protein
MVKAEITYNGGKSYTLSGVKFREGITLVSTDAGLINRCKSTAGFSVHVVEQKKKVVVQVENSGEKIS